LTKRASRAKGRPPGTDNSRAVILEKAREAFGTAGYGGTSIRAVAANAGVDPSTVIHFFGTKDGLFQAVIKDVAPATEPLLDALRRKVSGAELVTTYLGIWDQGDTGSAMRAIVRTSFGSDRAMGLLRGTMMRSVLEAAAAPSALGAELALMHLIAIGLGRYIVQLPELAGRDIADIAERVGPALDRYLS
jgi:AcrR family transcriptional regulator